MNDFDSDRPKLPFEFAKWYPFWPFCAPSGPLLAIAVPLLAIAAVVVVVVAATATMGDRGFCEQVIDRLCTGC